MEGEREEGEGGRGRREREEGEGGGRVRRERTDLAVLAEDPRVLGDTLFGINGFHEIIKGTFELSGGNEGLQCVAARVDVILGKKIKSK
jgi:hypothetical protein